MDISAANIAAATSVTAGALAARLRGGRVSPRRRHRVAGALAIAMTAALAVVAYLVDSLAALVSGLGRFQKASPFYHYAVGDPLRQGIAPAHAAILIAIAAISAVAGIALFERRDLHSA